MTGETPSLKRQTVKTSSLRSQHIRMEDLEDMQMGQPLTRHSMQAIQHYKNAHESTMIELQGSSVSVGCCSPSL